MVSTDHTSSFRSILAEKQTSSTSSSRSKSPIGRGRSPGGNGNKGKGKESAEGDDEEFLREAYRIQTHLVSLTTLLGTIRKPYLSLNSAPPRRARDQAVTEDDDGLKKWEGSKFLTDREKDEIDLRSKLILRRCRDRTAILEEGEKARQKTLTQPSSPHNFLSTLLPSLTSSPSTSNLGPLITAHRASVLWFLNDRMAKISTQISDMQEERAKRRDERGKSLGGLAAREAAQLGLSAPKTKPGPFAFMTDSKANDAADPLIAIKAEGGEEEEELTKEQIQQFQLENNAMLEHMESQLTSVLSAEKSIMEISSLQTELIGHLTQQSEMVDLLYDQAIGSVGEVDKANEQLKKAKQRGEEGRYFLLIFLIGASLALLFLDWYA